eukprot:2771407-Alexandrium_andersonii.AAC.1
MSRSHWHDDLPATPCAETCKRKLKLSKNVLHPCCAKWSGGCACMSLRRLQGASDETRLRSTRSSKIQPSPSGKLVQFRAERKKQ